MSASLAMSVGSDAALMAPKTELVCLQLLPSSHWPLLQNFVERHFDAAVVTISELDLLALKIAAGGHKCRFK